MSDNPRLNRGVRVTVEDLETGEKDSRTIPPGDYCVVTVEPCWYAVQAHANGTHVVTIKGRRGLAVPA